MIQMSICRLHMKVECRKSNKDKTLFLQILARKSSMAIYNILLTWESTLGGSKRMVKKNTKS